MEDNVQPCRGSVFRAALRGLVAGGASGLIATGLDVAFLPAMDRSLPLALAMAAVIAPLFAAAAAVSAVLYVLLRRLGVAAADGRWWSDRSVSAAIVAVASVPGLLVLVRLLAGGRRAREVIGSSLVQAGLVAGGALVIGIGARVALAIADRIAGARGRRFAPLAVAVLLCGATVGLFIADARLYRRLYGYLHALLCVAYWACGTLAVLALAAGLRRAERRFGTRSRTAAVAIALVAAAAALTWWGRSRLIRDQQMRFVVAEQATTAPQLLALLPLGVAAEHPVFLQTSPHRRARSKRGRYRIRNANVVLVTIDALRADHLGAYGYRRPTSPNIDALAVRSIRFQNAYSQVPLTCYSIPSLMTGDYLRSTLPLSPRPPRTLAELLRARGYTTAAFYNASIFFCDDKRAKAYGDRKFGFGYAETELRSAPQLTDRVLAYLRDFRNSGGGKLFLWVHYFDVHEPYRSRPDFPFGKRGVDRYDAEIAYTDRAIGRLIAALSVLPGPTVFVLTADHGEEFGEHGGSYHGSSLYEEQVRVPLIFAIPGLPPRIAGDPAQVVDVVPTLLELLGLRGPETVRGSSLLPEIEGARDPQRAAFSEVHTKKMVRVGRWKLIHDFRRSTEQVYDLSSDPRERTNLIARRPRQAARLKARLTSWFDRLRRADSKKEQRPEGIDLGRIGDRRAAPLLSRLMTDPDAASRWRQEAAQILGQLQDKRAADALWQAAAADDRRVADEASIALGELKDKRARRLLPMTLQRADDELRLRAAIAAGRVDIEAATPALIEGLYAEDWELQNRAAHYLGFVGDTRAVGPLIGVSKQLQLRSRAAVALGRIGARHKDRRILPFLMRLIRKDPHHDVRQRAVGAVALLDEPQAIRPLLRLLRDAPELSWVPEALIRLGAAGTPRLPGMDIGPGAQGLVSGWGRCHRSRSGSFQKFLNRTWCAVRRRRAVAAFDVQRPPPAAELLLRARALQASGGHGRELSVSLNGHRVGVLKLRRGWKAARVRVGRRRLRHGRNTVELRLQSGSKRSTGELVAIDYVLVARRPSAPARASR